MIPHDCTDKAPKKAPWEISYKPKSVTELQEEQKALVDKVCGLIESDVRDISFVLITTV